MDKNILKSKTFWVSVIVAIAPLFPMVQQFVSSNMQLVSMGVGLIFSALRIVSTDKVSLL